MQTSQRTSTPESFTKFPQIAKVVKHTYIHPYKHFYQNQKQKTNTKKREGKKAPPHTYRAHKTSMNNKRRKGISSLRRSKYE
jgi:hypothetical protein